MLTYSVPHLIGMYTSLYLGTMYIYSGTVISSPVVYFLTEIIGGLIVTGKSSKNCLVLAAITVLYVVNVVEGYIQWLSINLVIGISGQSKIEDLLAQTTTSLRDDVLVDITQNLPLIVADGLLVRYLCHSFDFR